MPLHIGAILRQHDSITELQLIHALEAQKRHGGKLGEILIGEGNIGYRALYRAIAERDGIPFVDLLAEPPERNLFTGIDPETCLHLRALPWRSHAGKVTVAATELSSDVMQWAKRAFGGNVSMVLTSPFDIRRAIEILFGETLESESRLSLWQRFPHFSARLTTTLPQRAMVCALLATIIALAAFHPIATIAWFVLLCQIAYISTMIFKCLVFTKGMAAPPEPHWEERLAALDEQTLPVYTILVPLYREAESLPGLLESLENFDYPASKLDIKLVLESDDYETYEAACALKPRPYVEIIRVPANEPRTKPKACNYALHFARGEMVTVFDAEDHPEPTQLKKSVLAFRALPSDVVCLQARLCYYNFGANWLTRFFSLEYTILFQFMLGGLERLGMPLPLGGTSNHMALTRLREFGEWDPYNVTEDADFGTRLAVRGMRTAVLDSDTEEEAPMRVMPWIRQRSRWIKGYMQTWLVHMRRPFTLYRRLGLKGFLGFQCFIGLPCFVFLTAPLVWAISMWWIMQPKIMQENSMSRGLMVIGIFNLTLYFLSHWILGIHAAKRYAERQRVMTGTALLYPLYLILHTIASYRALWQLIAKPHFWDKTAHGLDKYLQSAK